MSITDDAREAAELKRQQRLAEELAASSPPPAQTGYYRGSVDGVHEVVLADGAIIEAESIAPNEPEPRTRVAVYESTKGKWLFDSL